MSNYDQAPSDEVFDDIRIAAISIWLEYDDSSNYASDKISYINSFGNVKDNWGTIVGMFDQNNQKNYWIDLLLMSHERR